jgi:hypothetical protein
VRGTRVIAVTAALLLAALIAGAATIVSSSDNATTINPAHLVVSPGPLKSATGVLTYTDGTGINATAVCTFDFEHLSANIAANASLSIASVALEVRLVGPVLLFNTATLQSLTGAPWVSIRVPKGPAALARLGAVLRRPRLSMLPANRAAVVVTRGITTTTLWFNHVTLPPTTGLPIVLPTHGRLVTTFTTGAQGQVLAIAAHLWNGSADIHLHLQMTGYNQPVAIEVPHPSDVVPLTRPLARQVFGTNWPAVVHWLGRAGSPVP